MLAGPARPSHQEVNSSTERDMVAEADRAVMVLAEEEDHGSLHAEVDQPSRTYRVNYQATVHDAKGAACALIGFP